MTDHTRLYEIVQKVWNAACNFELQTSRALEDNDTLPAAYPVITPLIEELVKYCDDQIAVERESCAMIAQTLTPREIDTWYKEPAGVIGYNVSCTDVMMAIRKRTNKIVCDDCGKMTEAVSPHLPYCKPCWRKYREPIPRPSSPFRSIAIEDGRIVE